MIDDRAATELELYINNDADLHRQQHVPIFKNLMTKRARGQYKRDLAVKAFGYLVESGAKKYAKEFATPGEWNKIFSVPTRRRVAEELTKSFEVEADLGNYDNLLPKKYQTSSRGSTERHHSRVKAFSSKKAKWILPEGLVVRWAPVNNAWFVLWPASAPLNKQQVLKIAGTDELDSWLRDRYGASYGLASRAGRSHATIRKSPSQLNREIAEALGARRGRR
jgi:hypothetical protein